MDLREWVLWSRDQAATEKSWSFEGDLCCAVAVDNGQKLVVVI